MRVLLYALNHAPEMIGVGKYMGEMAAWLAARGHDVRVIAAPPYYPAWRVGEGYRAHRFARERRDGTTVYRCPLYVPQRPSGLRRVLHLASFALSSLPVALWQGLLWRPAAVFVVEPTLLCAPAAWAAARLGGAAAWLHVQDFEADVAFELGLIEGAWARRAVEALERVVMRRFDAVSAISPAMRERLADKRVMRDRIQLFENWVDTRVIHPLEGDSPMRAELGIDPAAIVALYAGNMGEKQGLEILIDSAGRLAERCDILFVMAGDGAARERLEEEARGLVNLRIVPLQPSGRLNDLLNVADIHLLPQRRDAADLVMPSKLVGMLATGKPVVAGAAPGTEVAALVGDRGVVVAPDDSAAMAEAIVSLAADPERRKALGSAARDLTVAEFDKDVVLSRFAERLEALASAGRGPQGR